MSKDSYDVVIVGGGISGVYAGWRLLTERAATRVVVLEKSKRIGGRLLSARPPGIPNMVAELGGMRILPAIQPRITRLIDHLNKAVGKDGKLIKTYDFPVNEPANISYLRGVHLRQSEFTTPGKLPYRLSFQEQSIDPSNIVINAIEQVVPGITNEKLSEEDRRKMAHAASFGGRPLHQQGFWQVLSRVMSGEAYQLAIDTGGYQSTISNWNAADAIPWYLSDFGVSPAYEGFVSGFQQVPLTTAACFQQAGGEIRMDADVVGFDWEKGTEGVTVRLSAGSIRASNLILAMPRRSLEWITPSSKFLQDPAVAALVRSVTPMPLFKLFTTYAYPWWLSAGVKKGRTTTDLPVRQTYYWPKSDGSPAEGGPALLMASYDDGLNVGFWDGFRPKRSGVAGKGSVVPQLLELFVSALRNAGRSKDADPEWDAHAAPFAMVEEVQRQVRLIHGLSFTPIVQEAAFKDWGADPYGGGWNSWNIGVKSDEVRNRITQPVDGAPVYICGEAYSDAQGWVEGALQTADIVLGKLGVGPLKGMPKGGAPERRLFPKPEPEPKPKPKP